VFDRQAEAHCHKRDGYGREVCKVMRGGTDVNLEQIHTGMAWCVREYAKDESPEDRASYAAKEEAARSACV
jgi:endonuclease YncB( thermonuclease family)